MKDTVNHRARAFRVSEVQRLGSSYMQNSTVNSKSHLEISNAVV